jgi:hypothetical protein
VSFLRAICKASSRSSPSSRVPWTPCKRFLFKPAVAGVMVVVVVLVIVRRYRFKWTSTVVDPLALSTDATTGVAVCCVLLDLLSTNVMQTLLPRIPDS